MKGEQLLNRLLYKSRVFMKRNSPTILTCIGAVGVVTTSVMAVKATLKAMTLIEEAKEEKGEDLTKMEIVRVAYPIYIPSVLVGVSTIACIFGANALNKRQQATLMSAYALLDNSYKEYKNKVKELYGEDANIQIRQEIAKDKYEETDIVVEDNKQLFYDELSERYFESTMEDVIRAEYELNRAIVTYGGAYLNDFYDFLNIPATDYSDHIGWSTWVDFEHVKTVMDDGLECYIIVMQHEPVPDFDEY